jgi:hypothetical protein
MSKLDRAASLIFLYLRRKVASLSRRYSGPSISEVWANPGGVEVPDAFASSAAVGCVFAPTAEFVAGVSSPSAATPPAHSQNFVAAVSGVLDPASAEVSGVLFAVERIVFPAVADIFGQALGFLCWLVQGGCGGGSSLGCTGFPGWAPAFSDRGGGLYCPPSFAGTTPRPVNEAGLEVAAMGGLPWFTEARSSWSVRAAWTCWV